MRLREAEQELESYYTWQMRSRKHTPVIHRSETEQEIRDRLSLGQFYSLLGNNPYITQYQYPGLSGDDAVRYDELLRTKDILLSEMQNQLLEYKEKLIRENFGTIAEIDQELTSLTKVGRSRYLARHDELLDEISALKKKIEAKITLEVLCILRACGWRMAVEFGRAPVAGVYFVYSKSLNLVYIGQSTNIEQRITKHHQAYSGDEVVAYVKVPEEDVRLNIEKNAIIHARPPMNRQYVPQDDV